MADSGFTPIQLYRTTTAAAAPVSGNLVAGEIAININDADMALYAKNNTGNVKRLMNNPAGLKYPTADGTANQFIKTDGLGNLTFGGTLAVANGGTGLTTLTAGYIPYGNGTGALSSSAGLFYDGTKLGIGTSSPLSFAKQTIQFDAGTITQALSLVAYGGSPTISFKTAGGTAASPSASTTVAISLMGSTTSDGTTFFNTSAIQSNVDSTVTTGSHPTHITFSTTPSGSTSRSERMRIDSSGNVGIGTSSPSTQLHIASATAKTRIDTTAAASNNPELQLTAVARQFNIGVGGATFATPALQGSYYIYDNTAATYRMVIDTSGNVGIGTSSPTGKLDVAGTIKTLGYTVAALPTGVTGARAYVTNALTPVFGATVVAGGAVTIPVFYNGTNWIVG
jgi:hypothetical protein